MSNASFTEKATKVIGETNYELLEEVGAFCLSFKAGTTQFRYDTFDGFTVNGTPMSFLRDNVNNSVMIMTLAEARELDRVAKAN